MPGCRLSCCSAGFAGSAGVVSPPAGTTGDSRRPPASPARPAASARRCGRARGSAAGAAGAASAGFAVRVRLSAAGRTRPSPGRCGACPPGPPPRSPAASVGSCLANCRELLRPSTAAGSRPRSGRGRQHLGPVRPADQFDRLGVPAAELRQRHQHRGERRPGTSASFTSGSPLTRHDPGHASPRRPRPAHRHGELRPDRQGERAAELQPVAEQHHLAPPVAGQVDHAGLPGATRWTQNELLTQLPRGRPGCSRRPAAGR